MTPTFVIKMSKGHYVILILSVIICVLSPAATWADDVPANVIESDEDLEEELEYLQAETYVITASRVMEDIKKAPASITVVTAKQIREMGARDLKDVMETVPGYDYYYNSFGSYSPESRRKYNLGTDYLVMINSHSINENYSGSANVGNMSLDNVKRIEFISGPGSALYGANAFAGVINIINKEAKDVDGLELTARGGSYDTQQYNILFGKNFNGFETVFNFNYHDTDGYEGVVTSDAYDFFDEFYGTDTSETPGGIDTYLEHYDASMTLKYKGFTIDGKYVDRSAGTPLEAYEVKDQTFTETSDYYLNLSYERTLWKGIDFSAKVYRNHFESSYQILALREGAYRPWFGADPAPQDLFEIWDVKNNRTGAEVQTNYETGTTNTIVAGITFEEQEQYDVETYANYLYDGTIFSSIQDVSDVYNHNQDVTRTFRAIFLEDIWEIRNNLRLTVGGRYDYYSDFGDHFSPRAGVVWEYLKGYDLKLLYGHAFRAPSFLQLYGYWYGNPDLGPETVDTYEISLGAEFTPPFKGRVTFYHSDYEDGIYYNVVEGGIVRVDNYVETQYQGFELDFKYDFRRGNYLAANYTYQTSEWGETKDTGGARPIYKGNIIANLRINKYLNFNTYCHFREGYIRPENDPRDDMAGHAIVNATLIAKKFLRRFKGLELRASVYNLFDEDYTMPSSSFRLPDDIPRPGRNYMLGIRYAF